MGMRKYFSSFEEFSAAIAEYIDHYNNRRIQSEAKWIAPCKVQDDIHLFGLSHNMCPGFWVHIKSHHPFLYSNAINYK